MNPIVILGAGGYAQEVLWVIDDLNRISPTWDFLGFIDPAAPTKKGQLLYDRPILGGFEAAGGLPKKLYFACGIGKPELRRKESLAAEELGWQGVPLVHPGAILARHVEIGSGTIIGASSILAPYVRLGRHCSVNFDVSFGHNSSVGDFCVLSPGARISGYAVLEECAFIGTNACVIQGQRIGAGATLGANSFQINDLEAGQSSLGVPARKLASIPRKPDGSEE